MLRTVTLVGALLTGPALAQPGSYSATSNKDAWMYPPVGSGLSQAAPTFGSPLGTEDPDRLGFYFLSFDLNALVDPTQGPYGIASITVTVSLLNSSTFSATNGVLYDPSYDGFETYLGIVPDADPGRPISLFAVMFNNGLSAPTWNETLTPVFQNGLYSVEPVDTDPLTGSVRSVLSNVDEGFDARPLGVATTANTYTALDGTLRIANSAALVFTLDLSDPDTRALLEDEINADGTLSFAISSLHAAGEFGQPGDEIWPRLGTRESFGLPDPSLQITLTTGPAGCGPADVTTTGTSNGTPDGVVDISDFSFYLTLWAAGEAAADLTTTGTTNGTPDGVVDVSDYSFYLTLWAGGCP